VCVCVCVCAVYIMYVVSTGTMIIIMQQLVYVMLIEQQLVPSLYSCRDKAIRAARVGWVLQCCTQGGNRLCALV
jgi:hypothetical protein